MKEKQLITKEQREALDAWRNYKYIPRISNYGYAIERQIEEIKKTEENWYANFEDSRYCVHLGS